MVVLGMSGQVLARPILFIRGFSRQPKCICPSADKVRDAIDSVLKDHMGEEQNHIWHTKMGELVVEKLGLNKASPSFADQSLNLPFPQLTLVEKSDSYTNNVLCLYNTNSDITLFSLYLLGTSYLGN